jgi:hypothetical protein
LLFLFIAVAAAYTQNVSTEDRNKDGKADRWIEHYGTGKVIIKSDNNYDDIIDSIVELDERGNKTYEEQDFNFDGKMDNFYYFTPGGVLMRQEIDSNYDGKIDIWIYLDKGVYINKIERDKDYDGKPDYAKIYRR